MVPTRRSTAEAFQILISHALGDAGSPFLVGIVSDAIKKMLRSTQSSLSEDLHSYSLISGNFTLSLPSDDVSQNLLDNLRPVSDIDMAVLTNYFLIGLPKPIGIPMSVKNSCSSLVSHLFQTF